MMQRVPWKGRGQASCTQCAATLKDIVGCISLSQVEKVLDAKVFKMEREIHPDGFDPNAPMEPDEEPEASDDDDEVR